MSQSPESRASRVAFVFHVAGLVVLPLLGSVVALVSAVRTGNPRVYFLASVLAAVALLGYRSRPVRPIRRDGPG